VKAALDRMSELEAERTRRAKTNKAKVSRQKEPRARRCTANIAPIPARRGPTTSPGWRTGASAWPASPAKPSTNNAQPPNAPNAWARRMGISRLLVRGKDKARAVLLWFTLAHNMLRVFALRRRAMAAAT